MDISVSVMALKAENTTPVNLASASGTGREYWPEPGGALTAGTAWQAVDVPPRDAVIAVGTGS